MEDGSYVAQEVTLEQAQLCEGDDCICNTNGEAEWLNYTESIFGEPAPFIQPVPVPKYSAELNIVTLG